MVMIQLLHKLAVSWGQKRHFSRENIFKVITLTPDLTAGVLPSASPSLHQDFRFTFSSSSRPGADPIKVTNICNLSNFRKYLSLVINSTNFMQTTRVTFLKEYL
jgi:hypothetical protein